MTRLNVLLPVAMRTGDWQRVVSLLAASPVPDAEPNLQKMAATLDHFAKGMIALDKKDLAEANLQSAALDAGLWHVSQQLDEEQAAEKKKKKDETAKPENKVAPTDGYLNPILKNLAVLSLELRAAIQVSSGKTAEAKALFAQASREEQDLGYREPPALIRPAAEQEAELLMSAGQTAEAEAAWRKALEDRPNSGFPLYGLAQLAEKTGNAEQAYTQFLEAWKDADPNLPQVVHAHQWIAEHGKQNASFNAGSTQLSKSLAK
jgi:tetratricopeptide (TPR) repeat protein